MKAVVTKPSDSTGHPTKNQSTPPRSVDWVAIERAYTTTLIALRDIGKEHGVAHSAIVKRAQRDAWKRPEQPKRVTRKLAKLEPRKRKFVEAFLEEPNATRAAMKAGWGGTKGSASTAGCEALKKPEVREAIQAERDRLSEKLAITRERVLAEYARIAFFDMRRAYNEDGALKRPHELDDDAAAAIAAFETVEIAGGQDAAPLAVRKVKWADKRAALDSIMKAQGWNKADVGTAENPLVIRGFTMTERAVRMSRALQANPELVAALASLVAKEEP
ncbi:terminase small subunit [Ottowia testudinis]|uniref:Terminase small subunit n=1 Tax=Ottowia testudinis TaxID=2816950 RepID=A0A975CE42_9BURK|nr:terminase small subunit [Ottowia testudinis]QTD44560.1 terminase small subunit [Ottowia testudinis]